MNWDDEYAGSRKIWGDVPSELAIIIVDYLRKNNLGKRRLMMLDIGCGYGRDEVYLSKHLNCDIKAIDSSQRAISTAQNTVSKLGIKNVDFAACNFADLAEDKYDVVFISNLYHSLKEQERKELRDKLKSLLRLNSMLFLNALSINDPEEYGKGTPIENEPHSFQGKKYLHFCTGEELRSDFDFLSMRELYEHKYGEPHYQGKTHHHISWILIGQKLDTGR
jgi:cyclopropane fatty-acyl-phospholipid synthase-like methyltransferase